MNLSLSQTLYNKYRALDAEVQGHIHAGLRSAPTTKTYKRWYQKKLIELQDARDAAKAKYDAVAEPDKRSHRDRMIARANGHPDLESTQAARRICEQRGYNWNDR